MRQEPWPSKTNPLHQAMEGLRSRNQGEGTTIGCIFEELQQRGTLLGLLLLTLPFVSPLPTLGLSAPVGALARVSGVAIGAWGYLFAVGDVTWSVLNNLINWV